MVTARAQAGQLAAAAAPVLGVSGQPPAGGRVGRAPRKDRCYHPTAHAVLPESVVGVTPCSSVSSVSFVSPELWGQSLVGSHLFQTQQASSPGAPGTEES